MLQYHFGYGKHGPARRGKRLRPTMVARACESAGGVLDDALDAAAAVELLHNYSLVHDDIEDSDRFRHGRPTLWSVYGIAQAINAGDAMCAISFLTLTHSGERSAGAAGARDDRAAARRASDHVRRAVARSAVRERRLGRYRRPTTA